MAVPGGCSTALTSLWWCRGAPPVFPGCAGTRPAHPASLRDLISESQQSGAVAVETMALVPVATSRGSHTAASRRQRGWLASAGAGPGRLRCRAGSGRCCRLGGCRQRLQRLGTPAWCRGSRLLTFPLPSAPLLHRSRSGGLGASGCCRCWAVNKLLVAAEERRQFSTIQVRNAQN